MIVPILGRYGSQRVGISSFIESVLRNFSTHRGPSTRHLFTGIVKRYLYASADTAHQHFTPMPFVRSFEIIVYKQ